jgi:hypothetical protein
MVWIVGQRNAGFNNGGHHPDYRTPSDGDRSGARHRFAEIWSRMQPTPDPFQECVLSHYMADLQDEIDMELRWDTRALNAALRATDEEAKHHHPSLSIEDFFPSLHLNLADDYLRTGDFRLRKTTSSGWAEPSISFNGFSLRTYDPRRL